MNIHAENVIRACLSSAFLCGVVPGVEVQLVDFPCSRRCWSPSSAVLLVWGRPSCRGIPGGSAVLEFWLHPTQAPGI